MSWPLNRELFQAINIPPEAPKEGRNSNLSKEGGQTFLRKLISNTSFLVSWKQTTSQEESTTLSLIAFHLVLALMPLTFQHIIFHFLLAV
jgi:hypothetical protein